VIEIRSLYSGYGGKDVLMGIDLQFMEQEFVGILGPNGSGKSTLLLTIAGIVPLRAGKVFIEGRAIEKTGPRWRAGRMASVPQKSEMSFPFRCLSIVLMGRYPYLSRWGGYSTRDMEASYNAMRQTDTVHLAQRLITEISGGEAQRIIIARALAQEPSLLLLDEATSNLDVARKIHIFDLLKQKNASQRTTILCAMHDLNLAALYCQRLIFIKDGKIVLDGPTEQTFSEDNLSHIYETEIRISRHPVTGSPQAHFVPGDYPSCMGSDHLPGSSPSHKGMGHQDRG